MAVAAGLVSNKDLWGTAVYDFAVWYGSVFGNAAVLFLGCVYAVGRYRANVGAAEASVPHGTIAAAPRAA